MEFLFKRDKFVFSSNTCCAICFSAFKVSPDFPKNFRYFFINIKFVNTSRKFYHCHTHGRNMCDFLPFHGSKFATKMHNNFNFYSFTGGCWCLKNFPISHLNCSKKKMTKNYYTTGFPSMMTPA